LIAPTHQHMPAIENLSLSENVSFKQIADESVLLNLSSGTYFGLNSVGTRIWSLLAEGKSVSTVCDVIEHEYASERQQIERDVRALVQTLLDNHLIRASGPGL